MRRGTESAWTLSTQQSNGAHSVGLENASFSGS